MKTNNFIKANRIISIITVLIITFANTILPAIAAEATYINTPYDFSLKDNILIAKYTNLLSDYITRNWATTILNRVYPKLVVLLEKSKGSIHLTALINELMDITKRQAVANRVSIPWAVTIVTTVPVNSTWSSASVTLSNSAVNDIIKSHKTSDEKYALLKKAWFTDREAKFLWIWFDKEGRNGLTGRGGGTSWDLVNIYADAYFCAPFSWDIPDYLVMWSYDWWSSSAPWVADRYMAITRLLIPTPKRTAPDAEILQYYARKDKFIYLEACAHFLTKQSKFRVSWDYTTHEVDYTQDEIYNIFKKIGKTYTKQTKSFWEQWVKIDDSFSVWTNSLFK